MSSFADTEQYIYRNAGSMLGQRRRRWLDIEPLKLQRLRSLMQTGE